MITGKAGLLSLVSVMGGKSPLRTLYLQSQSTGPQLTEPDMVEVYTKLAQGLGQYQDTQDYQSLFYIPNITSLIFVSESSNYGYTCSCTEHAYCEFSLTGKSVPCPLTVDS